MGLTDFLIPERVLPDLHGTTGEQVLDELAQTLPGAVRGSARRVLAEREALGSTGIGGGIAIPHGRLAELGAPLAVFGRSRHGVDFASMDGEPVFLFFALLGEEGAAGKQLKTLAQISRLLNNPSIRTELYRAEDREAILEIFDRET